jgi:hypothetical protein
VSIIRIRRFLQVVAAIALLAITAASANAATTVYYNVFNVEGENDIDAAFVTYGSLQDMANDENRTGLFIADGSGLFGTNIVGSGADGTTFWNLFNIEGESDVDAAFVTYASLQDMLNDENRTGLFIADGSGLFGTNIVGTGSDGTTYWNLFNIEGESDVDAAFVTYASLQDMFNDENRTGLFIADGSGLFGTNIVGTGAFTPRDPPAPVPVPATLWLLAAGIAVLAARRTPARLSPQRARPL